MHVRAGDTQRQRQSVPVNNQVDFRSCFAAVGRIRSRQWPPFAARRLTESIAHRDHSSSPRAPSSSRATRWSLAQTRSRLHWAKRRSTVCQHGPNTGGNCLHVQPDVATNTIVARASRSPARRRPPPCGRFISVGGTTRRNSTHNSSGTSRSTRSVMHRSSNDNAIRSAHLVIALRRGSMSAAESVASTATSSRPGAGRGRRQVTRDAARRPGTGLSSIPENALRTPSDNRSPPAGT